MVPSREWRAANPEKAREMSRRWARTGSVQSYARQLARGERILSYGNHHRGMAALKASLGDPRPAGLELSLIRPDSPSVYVGFVLRKGRRVAYKLSTDPSDYAWETRRQNLARVPRKPLTRPAEGV